ncbi:hypothetical protein KC345_g4296 [Hortaea werneckii]|nr:hypothetical protein KC345_g4296 [Hortaea werneckii]
MGNINSFLSPHQVVQSEDQPTEVTATTVDFYTAETPSIEPTTLEDEQVADQAVVDDALIQEEILTLIEPFDQSPRKPPFNEVEITVIATLCSYPCALNRTDIFCWISRMFTYYDHQLIDTCARCLRNNSAAGEYLEELLESRLGKSFERYDVPLRGIYPKAPYNEQSKFYTPVDFTVKPTAGRMFLRRWLEPEQRGTFPFLKLPPELRNEVYKLLFRFPESGIKIHSLGESGQEDDRVVMKVFSRIDGDEDPFDHVSKVPINGVRWEMNMPPTSEVLAILVTNKQIFAEACPLFYNLNRFRFSSIRALHTVLMDPTQTNRLQHIRSIQINLLRQSDHLHKFAPAMEALATHLTGLKKLEIRISADLWLRMNKRMQVKVGAGKEKFTGFEQIPGMKALASVASGVDEVAYTDEVETGSFKDFLEDEVRRIWDESATDMAPVDLKQAADQDGEGGKET